LARRVTQARRLVEITPQEVTGFAEDPYRFCYWQTVANGCHALILGLVCPGGGLTCWWSSGGAGVYGGAAQTEALSCQDEDVYIIGGANSAGQAAMYFSKYARKVTMFRGDSLAKSMSQYLIGRFGNTKH